MPWFVLLLAVLASPSHGRRVQVYKDVRDDGTAHAQKTIAKLFFSLHPASAFRSSGSAAFQSTGSRLHSGTVNRVPTIAMDSPDTQAMINSADVVFFDLPT